MNLSSTISDAIEVDSNGCVWPYPDSRSGSDVGDLTILLFLYTKNNLIL